MNYIYGLFCPVKCAIRYIGKSVDPQARFIGHITTAKTGRGQDHKARWIRKLLAQGLLPELRILATLKTGECWKTVERKFIADARARGHFLTNTTDGGDAFPVLSAEKRAEMSPKIAAGVRKAWTNPRKRKEWLAALNTQEAKQRKSKSLRKAYANPQTREALSIAMRRVWSTPERKEEARLRALKMLSNPEQNGRRIAAIRVAVNKSEAKARLAAAMAKILSKPEVKAKQSASSKALWGKLEYREKLFLPEARAKMSAKAKSNWRSNRSAMMKAMNAPDRVAKISAATTKRNTDPLFMAKLHSPEVKAKRNAAIKASWAKRKANKGDFPCHA
jgi:hypothetical protein